MRFLCTFINMSLVISLSPENYIIETEHIESCHTSNTTHNHSHCRVVIITCYENLIFREESTQWENTGNGKTTNKKSNMGNWHILAKISHIEFLVTAYSLYDTSCTEEEASLKHGMCKEVEHTCHITKSVHVSILSCCLCYNICLRIRHANTKSNKHETDL